MTHPYLANASACGVALRTLMGYPRHAPPFHTITWCTSGTLDIDQVMVVTRLATDTRSDLVHIALDPDNSEPLALSLFIRREHGIERMPDVLPYAASNTAKIGLLAHAERWSIGPRQVLSAAKLPPKSRWERGVAIARRRWREAVADIGPLQRGNSLWVPPGGRYADAIPQAALMIAA